MKCLFLSDAHYPKNQTVINFLLDNYEKFDAIFILGDLFEFYYGYKDFFYSHHLKLINSLDIVSKKSRVILFEGNHEYNLKTMAEFVDIEVIGKSLDIVIDNLKIHMEHGDTIDKDDLAYKIFRFSLKNNLTLRIIDKISPPLLYYLSEKASYFSKKHLNSRKYRSTDMALESFAKQKIRDGFDVVMLAHTHNPIMKKLGEGLYINSGDFFDNFSYVVYESGRGFSLNFLFGR